MRFARALRPDWQQLWQPPGRCDARAGGNRRRAEQKNFAGRSLLAAALASSIVFALSKGVPSLPIESNLTLSWRGFWLSPVIAIVAGAAGLAFQYKRWPFAREASVRCYPRPSSLSLELSAARSSRWRFSLAGRLGVFGLEQDLVAQNGHILWAVALCLLMAKLVATAACYGSGGCGGIFCATLVSSAVWPEHWSANSWQNHWPSRSRTRLFLR